MKSHSLKSPSNSTVPLQQSHGRSKVTGFSYSAFGMTRMTVSCITLALAASHINSVARELFDNQTPFDLFVGENEKKLLELLDLSPIAPDEVYLKPALLKTKPN